MTTNHHTAKALYWSLSAKKARPRHIVVLTPRGLGKPGGIDSLMSELHHELETGSYPAVRIYFITTRGYAPLVVSPGILLVALLRLLILKLLSRADVVHINLTKFGSTYRKIIFARTCRFLRIPYVLHLHSGIYDKFWDSCAGLIKKMIDDMFLHSRQIIVTGNYWKKVITDRSPGSEERTIIIPNATRSVTYTSPKSSEAINILFLGHHGPPKGIPQLISALSRLPSDLPWMATLAGNGLVDETRAAIERAGLGNRATVPGWVGPEAHDALLRAATIFVLPSFSENLPMAVIEAFAYGVAVICTPVGALPEIVNHGKTGLFVPPGDVDGLADALLRLAKDTELRHRLGMNAKAEHMTRLEIRHYMERLITVWTEASRPVP